MNGIIKNIFLGIGFIFFILLFVVIITMIFVYPRSPICSYFHNQMDLEILSLFIIYTLILLRLLFKINFNKIMSNIFIFCGVYLSISSIFHIFHPLQYNHPFQYKNFPMIPEFSFCFKEYEYDLPNEIWWNLLNYISFYWWYITTLIGVLSIVYGIKVLKTKK